MHTGKIVRVSGPVVDCAGFDGALPKIKEALTVTVGGEVRTMEVAAHIGDGTVRCVLLAGSENLALGMPVTATGSGIRVPIGKVTLGRMWNVLGEPIDGGEALPEGAVRREIHRAPPALRSSCPPPRSSRPASRSLTCLNLIRRAARSVCSAARAWARPC